METPVGSPPGYFSKDQVAVWHEIASNAPPGVLTSADAITLEIAATMLAEFRADSKAFTTARLTQLRAVLGSFGMNPSDRAKLDIPKAPNENPFAKIGK